MFICDQCNKEFKSNRALSGHKRMHGPSKGKIQINKTVCCINTHKEYRIQDWISHLLWLDKHAICFHPTCNNLAKPNHLYCSKSCATICNNKKRISPEQLYADKIRYDSRAKFRFSIWQYPTKFDISQVETIGWYHPINNPNGVSRDHMFSRSNGFNAGIDPELLAHPANCEIMLHSINNQKNTNSSITFNELLERINNW